MKLRRLQIIFAFIFAIMLIILGYQIKNIEIRLAPEPETVNVINERIENKAQVIGLLKGFLLYHDYGLDSGRILLSKIKDSLSGDTL